MSLKKFSLFSPKKKYYRDVGKNNEVVIIVTDTISRFSSQIQV